MGQVTEECRGRKSLAVVLRGHPDDFAWFLEQANIVGLYVVFSKSSTKKLIIQKVPF